MKIFWSAAALQNFEQSIDYIAAHNPSAAVRVARAIDRTAQELSTFQTGRRGRVGGTYEKVVGRPPYILAYAIDEAHDRVVILHVIHGAHDWPPGRWPR